MLKHIFTLAVLSHSVLCQFAPNERQLKDGADQGTGNEYQYCKDTCNTICDELCIPHHECAENEKLCGRGPTRVSTNGYLLEECPKDEICVDDDCFCPKKNNEGDDCPIVCNAHCRNDTQLECSGGVDNDGCKIQNKCVDKGYGNNNQICPGFCPDEHKCDDHELTCDVGNNPVTDCKLPPLCPPKQRDSKGEECSVQQCPLICTVTEHLCIGDIELDGCKEEDKCVTKGVSAQGETCPGSCPVECKNGWIKCDGVINYSPPYVHCKGQDVCHIKAKNYNGNYCPDNSASHDCPKNCPTDEVLCPPQEGALGCLEEHKCKKRSKDDKDDYCPLTADCPTVCKQYEVNCDGGTAVDGCKNPDLCIEQKRDFNGDLCTVHCPQVCGDEQVFCPGPRNPITGCVGADQCTDKENHKWGPDPETLCPGWCPSICNEHEVLCPSEIDPCNGCPTEEICREAIKDVNGRFCPGKEFTIQEENEDFRENGNRRGGFLSASHNCPKYCRDDNGEVLCPQYEDPLGCKPKAECMQRDKTSDGSEWCPSTSVCPKQCPANKKLCHYGDKDHRGCNVGDICVDIDTDNQGNLCAMEWCPAICTGDQILKELGDDEIGCRQCPYCAGGQ